MRAPEESEKGREKGQSAEHVRHTPRKPVPRRVIAPTPLSPTAALAPEVGGTPSKEDATPVKAPQQTWRDLCAREAAGLRRVQEAPAPMSPPSPSCSPLTDGPKDSPDLNDLPCAATETRSPSARRPPSRSRSPISPKPASRSRSPPGESLSAKRPRVVLTRRRSVLQRASATPKSNDSASSQSSQASASSASQRSSLSRSRSPITTRIKQAVPRNALFAVTPRRDPPKFGRADESSTGVTPRELQARLRADELRKELLKRNTMVKQLATGGSGETPCQSPGNSHSMHHASFPSNIGAPYFMEMEKTPKPAAPSPASAAFATPLPSPSPALGLVPQSPAESVAPSPRNLSLILQDVANDADCSSTKEQLVNGKQRMLEQLTQQMQKCLTRVQDQRLDDASREKYQTLALSMQSQLVKLGNIRRPAGSPLARGGC